MEKAVDELLWSSADSLTTSTSISAPEQTLDFSYKMPLLKNPLEQYYLVQGGFKRTDLNDTESDSTTLVASRYWDLSSGWQRAINLRWSLDHFTQGEITNTTMLFYPGVMISRTRSRGGLMPTWGDSQRYSIDYSNTAWGSDVDFSVFQAQNVWIRTLYDRHRFVTRGTLGWIETGDFEFTKYRRICVSSPGAIAVFAATNTNLSPRNTPTVT
ncbi:hypothetical protein EIMP300_87040 [Escherichia coli]|uniref:Outer membrane protein assembly factor n=1 Tax=Escherichia coli TaxID=562 RepID=A0A8S0G2S6_ECOLX|nr:hypothetical protein EIMP300_87040 [Escherichia coli]